MTQGKSIRISKDERELLARLLNKHIAALQDKCKAQARNNENNYETFQKLNKVLDLRLRLTE